MKSDSTRVARPAMRRRLVFWVVALLTLACSGGLTDVTPVLSNAVNTIVITPSTATLALGEQLPLQAVATDIDGKVVAAPDLIWTVRDSAIASVSSTGVISAKGLGSTQVAASANGHSAVATITVAIPAVASVVLTPTHVDAVVGAKTQFTAAALDASQRPLSGRTITWTSTNEFVATVDATGSMTARSAGTASIIATSEGKSASATVTVTQAPLASVAITPNPLSMSVGQSTQLTAVTTDTAGNVVTGRAVTWSTSDPAIATVSASGVLAAIAPGSVRITASVEGKSGTADVTISNFAVGSVSVQPQTAFVVEHSSTQLSAVVLDVTGATTTGRVVTWATSNASVATVSSSGLATGIAPGTATITATSEGKAGTSTVTVTPAPADRVVLSAPATNITVGQSLTIGYVVLDAGGLALQGRTPVWASSNTNVATVSAGGVVTAVAPGTVVISATFEGKVGTAPITVVAIPVASVTIAPSSASVTVGQTAPLSATPKDASGNVLSGRGIAWSTSDATIASVSSTGVVTGVGAGSATITATSEGRSGTASVTVTPVPVAKVSLPATTSLVVGQTTTLTPTVTDANGVVLTNRVVTWSSDNGAVATVSSSGLVTGVSSGTATITATSEGQSGSTVVTVSPAPVSSIAINPGSVSLVAGQTTTLLAVLKDAAGNTLTGRTIAWSSNATGVATVSSAGLVTAVAPGTATITAASEGQSATASVTVSAIPVASVAVTPPSADIVVGGTATFTAAAKDASGNVLTGREITWTVDKSAVATVSSTGVVTGVGAGTAKITAASGAVSGSANVTVTLAPVASVTLTPNNASIVVGGTAPLTATLKDAAGNVLTGRTIQWSSSTPGVATVSSTGVVTGVAAGSTTITATSEGQSGTATITVSPVPAASVSIAPGSVTLASGATAPLTATVKDAAGNVLAGRAVTWSAAPTSVATVSATGVVTGVAPGTATITATSGSASGTASVTVTLAPVATVAVNPASATLTAGSTTTLTTTLKDANGNTLTGRTVAWSTNAASVATVSGTGLVTAVAPGTATITATSEGQSGSASITVTEVAAASVTIAPPSATLVEGATAPLSATVKDAGGKVLTGRTITWSSDAPATATVSAAGVVTAVKAGSATITATSGSASGTASITVTPVPAASVTITPSTLSVVVGTTGPLTATVKDAAGNVLTGRTVTWAAAPTAVATVSSTGVVTGESVGTATITATSGSASGTATVTVTPVPVATVTVSPGSATLTIGGTAPLSATLKDADGHVLTGRTITWSTNASSVATVSPAGVVTAVGAGTATITATSGTASGSATITVTGPPVSTVTVSPGNPKVAVGKSVTLTATLKDAGGHVLTGRVITWTSNAPTIATVTADGTVTAHAKGSAIITATSEGKSDTADLTVTP